MANNISCDAHDYFEIVCMRRNLIKVTTKDNKKYHGIAIDIKLVEKQEYLQISDGIKTHNVALITVKRLEALENSNAHHNLSMTW
jgi:Rho-binding antiterminator